MNLAKSLRISNKWLLSAAILIAPARVFAEAAIESGAYSSGILDTNNPANSIVFEAAANDSVIVRVANEDSVYSDIPDLFLSYVATVPSPSTNVLIASATNASDVAAHEVSKTLANAGWYRITCGLPARLAAFKDTLSYSVSLLRMPKAPLSYADPQVGPIYSGQSLEGTIAVGADLDAATFAVSNRCTVLLRMGQQNVSLVPRLRLYGPTGENITNAPVTEYRSELTVLLSVTGIYTVVCNDQLNSVGDYAVSMAQIPSASGTNALELGRIVSGDTIEGEIELPGNMDVATFTGSTGDVVELVMTELDAALDPVMHLFDPAGNLLATGTDPMQKSAIITNSILTNGLFTVVCKDSEDRHDVKYTLTMRLLTGSSTSSIPAAPTSVVASDGTYSDHIDVTWSSSSGAIGYDLWRSHGTNAATQIAADHTSLSYQDYDVEPGVMYYYKVRARNDYGVGDLSASDSGYCGTLIESSIRRALLVGINEYSPAYGAGSLSACIPDAIGIRDTMLLDDPSNRWSSADMLMLTNAQATRASIRGAMATLASSSSAGDLILYYQSSHGGQTDPSVNPSNTFVCAYDADYTDSELAEDLAVFLADVNIIVIIDACYSGGMFKNADGAPEWPFAKNVMAAYKKIKADEFAAKGLAIPKTLGNNIAFMTACDYDEVSWESGPHGIYTGYLLDGCAISEVDTNEDGEYQFLELHAYAAEKAAEATEGSDQQNAQSLNDSLLGAVAARATGEPGTSVAAGLDNDYDGDGVSDLAVYHEASGAWFILSLNKGVITWGTAWGGPGFSPRTGDYDGDGTADLAVYHEEAGQWFIWSIAKGLISWGTAWGGPGLTPVAGDYSGNGVSDLALYDKAKGYWYIITLSGYPVVLGQSWAGTGFTALSGDYDGDGADDLAMYHDSMGYWYITTPLGSHVLWGLHWGGSGYDCVPGDYDGDGIFDIAVYCPYTGLWYVWSNAEQNTIAWAHSWGGPGYEPVPGDYNGDGNWDLAVYSETTGQWFVVSPDGDQVITAATPFGGPGFIPVRAWK